MLHSFPIKVNVIWAVSGKIIVIRAIPVGLMQQWFYTFPLTEIQL